MLVDDHAAFRQVVKTVLQPLGAQFVECQDGQEAVAAYPQLQPDVVLMDIAMKGTNGLTATAQIVGRFPDARIVILTQYDECELRSAAEQAGACGFLVKDDLAQVRTLLQRLQNETDQ